VVKLGNAVAARSVSGPWRRGGLSMIL